MVKTIKTEIEGYDGDFFGTFRLFGKEKRIKGVIEGEKIETALTAHTNGEELWELKKVITPSPNRTAVVCPHFLRCGGCSLLHVNYDEQKQLKRQYVERNLSKIKGIKINPTVSLNIDEYRNKVHLAFTIKDKKTRVGFFDEFTHDVIPVDRCAMHGEWFAFLTETIEKWANESEIPVYEPKNGRGILRFAVARVIGDSIQLTIVINRNVDLYIEKLHNMLSRRFTHISLYSNINPMKNSVVFTGNFRHIAGDEKIFGTICGIKFSLSPSDFLQINTDTAQKIYMDICREVEAGNEKTVIDAYSGIGITGMLFASTGKKVVSIEICESSAEDARITAKNNGIKNFDVVTGDFADAVKNVDGRDALFFVDPPRQGLGREVCDAVSAFCPKRIIYLSCNARSLAQDLRYFVRNGYMALYATPYDMFPNTKHTEVLVSLERCEKQTCG